MSPSFADLTLGQGFQTQGPQIFDLHFIGSGTMTLFGEVLENDQLVKFDSAGICWFKLFLIFHLVRALFFPKRRRFPRKFNSKV